jgi:hypothetical protein
MQRDTYDNMPDLHFFRVHPVVIVGLGFGLFAAQADVKHRVVDVGDFVGMFVESV